MVDNKKQAAVYAARRILLKSELNAGAPEGRAFPAIVGVPIVLILKDTNII
jgi:hypothetical protein